MTTIKLNNKIFRKNIIKQAMKTYSHVADFSMEAGERHFVITVTAGDEKDEQVIADEFGNFALVRAIEGSK